MSTTPDPFATTAASSDALPGADGASPFAPPPKASPEAAWDAYLRARQAMLEPRAATGFELEMPSGLPVFAQRIPLLTLLGHGSIPDALTPLVNRFLTSHQTGIAEYIDATVEDVVANPEAMVEKFTTLLRTVWVNAVLRPAFAFNPGEGPRDAAGAPTALPVAAVDLDDLLYLFEWCQGVTLSLASFRKRQALAVEAARQSENLRDAAQYALGRLSDPAELALLADQ